MRRTPQSRRPPATSSTSTTSISIAAAAAAAAAIAAALYLHLQNCRSHTLASGLKTISSAPRRPTRRASIFCCDRPGSVSAHQTTALLETCRELTTTPLFQRIDARVARALGVNSSSHLEHGYVQRYTAGYRATHQVHLDQGKGDIRPRRYASAIVYLDDQPFGSGHTVFPFADARYDRPAAWLPPALPVSAAVAQTRATPGRRCCATRCRRDSSTRAAAVTTSSADCRSNAPPAAASAQARERTSRDAEVDPRDVVANWPGRHEWCRAPPRTTVSRLRVISRLARAAKLPVAVQELPAPPPAPQARPTFRGEREADPHPQTGARRCLHPRERASS